MYCVVWEFRTRPGSELAFEKAYGSDGDWARLFRTDPHYRGTDLFRDTADPTRFLTIDRWDSREFFEDFHHRHQADYSALDQRLAPLCAEELRRGDLRSD